MRTALTLFTILMTICANAPAAPVQAGELQTLAALNMSPDPARVPARNVIRNIQDRIRMAAACGLCSDVDCCGGSANGWKLCSSNCPEGQYKCMQVATCP